MRNYLIIGPAHYLTLVDPLFITNEIPPTPLTRLEAAEKLERGWRSLDAKGSDAKPCSPKTKIMKIHVLITIPCKTGKHTTEKPVLAKAVAAPKQPVYETSNTVNLSSKYSCSRCRQGFFCSDHGSQARASNSKVSHPVLDAPSENNRMLQDAQPPKPKKLVDISQSQTCKNKGCGKTFKEKDNHDEACSYHPGPAVFHDRMRGWKCCDIHVKEFDEFMNIPPCAKGWHNADPES